MREQIWIHNPWMLKGCHRYYGRLSTRFKQAVKQFWLNIAVALLFFGGRVGSAGKNRS